MHHDKKLLYYAREAKKTRSYEVANAVTTLFLHRFFQSEEEGDMREGIFLTIETNEPERRGPKILGSDLIVVSLHIDAQVRKVNIPAPFVREKVLREIFENSFYVQREKHDRTISSGSPKRRQNLWQKVIDLIGHDAIEDSVNSILRPRLARRVLADMEKSVSHTPA